MKHSVPAQTENDLIDFYRNAIRTRSYSNQEGDIAVLILKEMEKLGYDECYIDRVGNVVGRVGSGKKIIHFDSHMDTVNAGDPALWDHPPFSADYADEYIYGRGSVDMKGGLSASVYAAAEAKKQGLLDGKTVYVTTTVCEEDCDGVNLINFYKDSGIKPNFVFICEPSYNVITLGHNGKMQLRIRTQGISAHGSAPEKGVNAVYEMAEIITRVDELNKRLQKTEGKGTVVLSKISSVAASLNAVPSECEIYLDRRLRLGETIEDVKKEMDALVEGKPAKWELGVLKETSWKGEELVYLPEHDPWKIAEDAELTKACIRAYEDVFGEKPKKFEFWDFGTNAVVPVSMGIPTIGFGPGEYKLAHMINERCRPEQVKEAANFYLNTIAEL